MASEISPRPHPTVEIGEARERRALGEVARARKRLEQHLALARAVLVEGGVGQPLDVEGDAEADRQHQDERAQKGEGDADGVARDLHRLAPGEGPDP